MAFNGIVSVNRLTAIVKLWLQPFSSAFDFPEINFAALWHSPAHFWNFFSFRFFLLVIFSSPLSLIVILHLFSNRTNSLSRCF